MTDNSNPPSIKKDKAETISDELTELLEDIDDAKEASPLTANIDIDDDDDDDDDGDGKNNLLGEIKNSILDMQQQMQQTYKSLSDTKIIGESHDKTVRAIMSATYEFEDIEFDKQAFSGGVKEFKWRIREAMKDLHKNIKKMTESKTLQLLQGMQIPEEIRNITAPATQEDEEEGGEEGGGDSNPAEAA